jgi:CubicO group peptidase (beta-lactamase class C family)
MAHKIRPFILFVSFVAVLATARAADPGPLAGVLQKEIDNHVIGGAVVLVADKDHVLDLEAAGYSSMSEKTPMQTDALFYLASMTKTFTGVAVMMMVDEGKMKLDDPVEKYLPEFKGQMVVQGKEPPHPPKHPITVREIMSHTSALAPSYEPSIQHIYSLKEKVEKIASIPLQWEPGTVYKYDNAGINTGARLVEVLSGIPFPDFLQQRILTPLAMKDTTYWPDETLAKRLANTTERNKDKTGLVDTLHARDMTPESRQKFGRGVDVPQPMLNNFGQEMLFTYSRHYGEGAHGLLSTATDVGRFCQMLLNNGTLDGKRYLSEDAVKQMGAVQTGEATTPPDMAYGVGTFVFKKNSEGPAAGTYGHFGSHKTCMWIDPQNQLAMILMVQDASMNGDQQKDLYRAVFTPMVEKFGKKPGTEAK